MHLTPTFLPILMHALVSVARAVPLHANAGLGDLAIRAPSDLICVVTGQQGGTSTVHDEHRTTEMVKWVFQDRAVMEKVLGQTNPLQITYPNPYPYRIRKLYDQPGLRTIYQSIEEVSGVRLSYLQIVGGLNSCKESGLQTKPCNILVGENAKGDMFGIINSGRANGLRGSVALASFSRFPIKGTPNLNVAVNNLAKSSVRWLFEQPEMIAKFGSLVIAFLNDFPLESISPNESVHFQFYGAPGSPCAEKKPCFALVGINDEHAAGSVHYGAVWDYDYGLGVNRGRQPIVVAQVTVPRAQQIASTHASEHGSPQ